MHLRSACLLLIMGHLFSAICAVFFIGSLTMFVAQFLYISMLYSIYLALHGWLIWVYMLVVGINGVHGILGILGEDGIGFLFYAMVISFYIMAVRKLFLASKEFREGKPGGDVTGRVLGNVTRTVATGVRNQMGQRADRP